MKAPNYNESGLLHELSAHAIVAVLGGVATYLIPENQKLFALLATLGALLAMRFIRPFVWFARKCWMAAVHFESGGDSLHAFVHKCRDLSLKLQPQIGRYKTPKCTDGKPLPNPWLSAFESDINAILADMHSYFHGLAPTSARKVWVSLRELRSDLQYHTFARVGRYSPSRSQKSEPLPMDSSTVRWLENSLRSNRCVIHTSCLNGPEMWTPLTNSTLREDKSVLMGAIVIKSWIPEKRDFGRSQIAWIVCVCADVENAWDDSHLSHMKIFVDSLSSICNSIARKAEEAPIEKTKAVASSEM